MTTFLNQLARDTNLTLTENGAVTNASSLDPVVDFFSLAGAMRNDPQGAADLFEKAYRYDQLTAVRTLFYLRDVRGGQGERAVFRACLQRLAAMSDGNCSKVFEHIPFFGRWDDVLFNGVTIAAAEMIQKQLAKDMFDAGRGESISLLAKWLPSENASSADTKRLAKALRTRLGHTPAQYRRTLSFLRDKIRLLEQDMSSNNWGEIDYGKLPGQAHRRHTKAFKRHTPDRYQAYLDAVQKGEAKINVSTVYPYEIFKMVTGSGYGYNTFHEDQAADVMWANLPDYTQGKNAMVMADVSGSMVRPNQPNNPIAVSVSLALYFAERNKGPLANHFMTFSGQPQLVKVKGNTLAQKMQNINNAEWAQNTDLSLALRTLLQAAKADPENAPEVLYIISDMEFDQAVPQKGGYSVVPHRYYDPMWGWRVRNVTIQQPASSHDTVFETAKREWAAAGLKLPHVVFWNVDARNMQTPATILDNQVSLVSGCSPTVFAMAVEGKSPRQLVDSVVNAERYQRITL